MLMDEVLLFTVEEAFQISGRGCVLVPGIPEEHESLDVHVGDVVRLVKPDGEAIETKIRGVEMINYGTRPRPTVISVPILVGGEVTKQDVPRGTRVFLVKPVAPTHRRNA
jgi:translation elongation factor EF-Tu-like GTPase